MSWESPVLGESVSMYEEQQDVQEFWHLLYDAIRKASPDGGEGVAALVEGRKLTCQLRWPHLAATHREHRRVARLVVRHIVAQSPRLRPARAPVVVTDAKLSAEAPVDLNMPGVDDMWGCPAMLSDAQRDAKAAAVVRGMLHNLPAMHHPLHLHALSY